MQKDMEKTSPTRTFLLRLLMVAFHKLPAYLSDGSVHSGSRFPFRRLRCDGVPYIGVLLTFAALTLTSCHTRTEADYVDFLYANLSLPDRTDYSREYYEEQVRTSLRAREEMPWGESVPEREFRHFVLPPRVNNEDMDDFRTRYYDELAARVKGMSMAEAILEVNHWCHEHVTYRPTDARTLGPVSTIRTAYGRCGEESVLTVAALRTVSIPARQVYTPRWAHTDDNHAWVEAWADGQWHFLGACEPEPRLDMGWFNESASRGMLMHTKVFGNYDGPEEVVSREKALTEINVIDNYARATCLTVTVVDVAGRPVEGATVEFKVYNYAEFYTVARKQTDADGHAALTAGHGTMLVWATGNGGVAVQQVDFAHETEATLQLTDDGWPIGGTGETVLFDVVPPAVSRSLPAVTDEELTECNRRLAQEDSIRHAYEATMNDERIRGNATEITAFRRWADEHGLTERAEALLAVLPEKDLHDTPVEVLADACTSEGDTADETYRRYILSPRIERELLTAYKEMLHEAFTGFSAMQLAAWTRDSIEVITDENPQHLRMRPLGVYASRRADALGRDIFFVAAARSIGIAARINEVNGKVQWCAEDGQWMDVDFGQDAAEDETTAKTPQGRLVLSYTPTAHVPDAKYYIHFTLARLDDDHRLNLLTYPEEGTTAASFANGVELDAGRYVLTTGTRLADGGVMAAMRTIDVRAGETTHVTFTLREQEDAVQVIGALNAENLFLPWKPDASTVTAGEAISLLATCGRGYYVVGLIAPNHEPTNHALRDIGLARTELEAWGRKMVLLFEDEAAAQRFNHAEFADLLPSTVVWGIDRQGTIRDELIRELHLSSGTLPVFAVCDSFNRVVFVSQGYTIGLGEQLAKVVKQLK